MKDPIFVKDRAVVSGGPVVTVVKDGKEHHYQAWPAHPVNVAESSSPMPGLSLKQERAESQTLQEKDWQRIHSELKTPNALERIEAALNRMAESQSRQESILLKIIEALAEDQDPDEMPALYMDGSKV
jgi:hypothetical protein